MKILVIQTAFPGDAILTLPLIQKLHSIENSVTVDVLCLPSTKIIFQASQIVDNVIVYDKNGKESGLRSFYQLIKKIRAKKYQCVISPHRSARSSLISYFSSAPKRVTFSSSSLNFLYTHRFDYINEWHEVKRNISLAGFPNDEDKWKILPDVVITEDEINYTDQLLKEIDLSKSVVIAPGSVWETKKYPVEYYGEIAKTITQSGYNILLVGSVEDKNLAENIVKGNNNIINLCGKLSFLHTIQLMKKVKSVICNDSAPTHLAMCANSAVLTIYCSTAPEFGFYPYNTKGSYISYDDLDCKPCGIHGHNKCPEGHFNCGKYLKPKLVLERIFEMLSEGYSTDN